MKILMTGGAGFIGHHMVEHIMRGFTSFDDVGTEICILDRIDETSSFERLTDIETYFDWEDQISTVWHDLKSPINPTVTNIIQDKLGGHPDYIIHLAASTHVDRSITDPMSFVYDNVVGTGHLLDYARQLRHLEKVLIFSTDEVYGPAPGETLYVEGDRHNPGNPYAATKSAAESLARSYRNTYKLPVLITNCMNVFGERQNAEKFFPMTINKVLSGGLNIVHSDSSKTISGSRFYLHARNCADATIHVLLEGDPFESDEPESGTYHIVGEEEVSNYEVVCLIHELVNSIKGGIPDLDYEFVDFHSSRPGHDLRYGQSGEKLKRSGFEFAVSFEESLEKTVRWYLDNLEWLI